MLRPRWIAPPRGACAPPSPGTVDLWRMDALPGARREVRASQREAARGILGRYVSEGDARLVRGMHGKPAFDPPLVRFSISHSECVLLVAVCADAELGVDVELVRPRRPVVALARRTWGEEEAAALQALPPERRAEWFHRAWTRHEAARKCMGTGLAVTPDAPLPVATDLDLGDGVPAALARIGGPPALVRGLQPGR